MHVYRDRELSLGHSNSDGSNQAVGEFVSAAFYSPLFRLLVTNIHCVGGVCVYTRRRRIWLPMSAIGRQTDRQTAVCVYTYSYM